MFYIIVKVLIIVDIKLHISFLIGRENLPFDIVKRPAQLEQEIKNDTLKSCCNFNYKFVKKTIALTIKQETILPLQKTNSS